MIKHIDKREGKNETINQFFLSLTYAAYLVKNHNDNKIDESCSCWSSDINCAHIVVALSC